MVEPVTLITLGVMCILGAISVFNVAKEEIRSHREKKFKSYKRRVFDNQEHIYWFLLDILHQNTGHRLVKTVYRVNLTSDQHLDLGGPVEVIGDVVCFEEKTDNSVFKYGMWLYFDQTAMNVIMYTRNERAQKQFMDVLRGYVDLSLKCEVETIANKFELCDIWQPN